MGLTNKQYKTYDHISRYINVPIYYNTDSGTWQMGTTKYLDDTTSYLNHTVQNLETYDRIALYYYNNPTLYWVICDFNRIQDPFIEPTVGTILKIPTLSNIRYED